jgi:hypothetical protein
MQAAGQLNKIKRGTDKQADADEPQKKKPRWDVAAPMATIPEQPSMSPPPLLSPPPPQSNEPLPGFAELDSFFKSLDAATAGIPTPAEKLSHLKEQAEAMRIEEEEAIKSLIAANDKPPKNDDDEDGFTKEEEMAMIEHIAATDRIDTLSDEEKFYAKRKDELDEELEKMKKKEPVIRLPVSPMSDDENKENIPPEKKEDLDDIEFVGETLNNIPVFTI